MRLIESKISTGRRGDSGEHDDFRAGPPESADALGPCKPVRSLLDLAGDERCAPEDADERRQDEEQGKQDERELDQALSCLGSWLGRTP